MKKTILLTAVAVLLILFLVFLAMQVWRGMDKRADDAAWQQLKKAGAGARKVFEPAMVQDLPEAARRYFMFTIAPGTLLSPVTEIRMRGEIGLGTREAPNYQPMKAVQILAPPHGFVWRLEAGLGATKMSGSDGMVNDQSWTRFWLDWTIPIVRSGGDDNHLRSSLGRVVAEAAFWAPASLLPGDGVRWEDTGVPNRARAIVARGELRQSLEIEVDEDGRPRWVKIARWSNVNPEGEWRLQSFGGPVADFRRFGGFMLPARVEGGNHFGTGDYFPFFRAQVEALNVVQ